MKHLESVQLVDMVPSTSPAGCAEEDRLAALKVQTSTPSGDRVVDSTRGETSSAIARLVRSLLSTLLSRK